MTINEDAPVAIAFVFSNAAGVYAELITDVLKFSSACKDVRAAIATVGYAVAEVNVLWSDFCRKLLLKAC